MRARDYDPAGTRHGIPTYPWRYAPEGLATRRQLREDGLRPGGQPPAAQILCRRGQRVAYLYRRDLALPVREMTPARRRALDAAMAARQTCPTCGTRFPYCLPLRTLGACPSCAGDSEYAPAA